MHAPKADPGHDDGNQRHEPPPRKVVYNQKPGGEQCEDDGNSHRPVIAEDEAIYEFHNRHRASTN
jgi:hypothetical protein